MKTGGPSGDVDRAHRAPPPSCSDCGGPYAFDVGLPNATWNRVIRKGGPEHDREFLCVQCIVRQFAEVGEAFTGDLVGGVSGTLTFTPPPPQEGGDAHASNATRSGPEVVSGSASSRDVGQLGVDASLVRGEPGRPQTPCNDASPSPEAATQYIRALARDGNLAFANGDWIPCPRGCGVIMIEEQLTEHEGECRARMRELEMALQEAGGWSTPGSVTLSPKDVAAVREALSKLEAKPRSALGPFEIAGTDHNPQLLRCMLEGVVAGVRALRAALPFLEAPDA